MVLEREGKLGAGDLRRMRGNKRIYRRLRKIIQQKAGDIILLNAPLFIHHCMTHI